MNIFHNFIQLISAFFITVSGIINPSIKTVPTPTTILILTPTTVVQNIIEPTITQISNINNNTVVSNNDPPVHCQIHANCGGGTTPLKQSECNNSICCQIGNKWIFYKDDKQCSRDQGQNVQQVRQPVFTQPDNPEFKINCSYSSGEYYFDYGMLTFNECLTKSNEYWNQKKQDLNSILPSTSKLQTSKLSQDQIDNCKSKVREEADNLFHGCVNQFGDSSAAKMCMIARQKEISTQITNCENYGTYTPMSRYIPTNPTPICRMTPYGCFSD